MEIILTISIICALLYFTYLANGQDILCPSALMSIAYILALICSFLYREEWEVQISARTISLIILSISITIVTDCIAKRRYHRRITIARQMAAESTCYTYYDVSDMSLMMFLSIAIVALILCFRELLSGGMTGTLSQIIGKTRAAGYSTVDGEGGLSGFANQLIRIAGIEATLFTYLFLQNLVIKKKTLKTVIYGVIILICISVTLLSGARSTMLKTFITGVAVFYLLKIKYSNSAMRKISAKLMRKMLIAIPIVLLLFWGLRTMMGRGARINSWSFLQYISFYIGGGIPALEDYFAHPITADKMIGEETFATIYTFLSKFVDNIDVTRHLEFRRLGVFNGNVYTAIRRYYHDFGVIGFIVLQIVFSSVYSNAYFKSLRNVYDTRRKKQFLVLLYCYLYYPIVYHPIDDQFYSNVISTTMIINVFLLWVMWRLFLRKNTVEIHRGQN